MRKSARKITYPAVASAVSVVLLLLASVIPSGQLGFVAATVFLTLYSVSASGVMSAVYIYLITSLIALLILPDKVPVVFYASFFGLYPIIKVFAEKLSKSYSWAIKLIFLFISLYIIKLFLSDLILGFSIFNSFIIAYYLICGAVFIVFDIGVSAICSRFETKKAP